MLDIIMSGDFDVKRDMDLARDLLIQIEKSPRGLSSSMLIPRTDERKDEKYYLLDKMIEANLVCGSNAIVIGNHKERMNIEMTWDGHDFLDNIRDTEIWSMTKKGAGDAGSLSFDLLKALAKGYLKTKIEEKTGIKLEL